MCAAALLLIWFSLLAVLSVADLTPSTAFSNLPSATVKAIKPKTQIAVMISLFMFLAFLVVLR